MDLGARVGTHIAAQVLQQWFAQFARIEFEQVPYSGSGSPIVFTVSSAADQRIAISLPQESHSIP
jgi:hypothetical protein